MTNVYGASVTVGSVTKHGLVVAPSRDHALFFLGSQRGEVASGVPVSIALTEDISGNDALTRAFQDASLCTSLPR